MKVRAKATSARLIGRITSNDMKRGKWDSEIEKVWDEMVRCGTSANAALAAVRKEGSRCAD